MDADKEELDFDSKSHSDICRVCRLEGLPEQPLFHPCKCSGSIKYVHQECLLEWLKHSRKKHCELCKFPYRFTPVYREKMPTRLPITLIFITSARVFLRIAFFTFRLVNCLTVWCFLMPILSSLLVHVAHGKNVSSILDKDLWVISEFLISGWIMTFSFLVMTLGILALKNYMQRNNLMKIPIIRRNRDLDFEDQAINKSPFLAENIISDETRLLDTELNIHEMDDGTSMAPTEYELDSIYTDTQSVAASRNIEKSWRQGVSVRDYRAYLRRRDLKRQRRERHLHDVPPSDIDEDLEIFAHGSVKADDEKESTAAPSLPSTSNFASISQPMSRNSNRDDPSSLNPIIDDFRRRTGQNSFVKADNSFGSTFAQGHIFKDSIRCRICGSMTCVKKEHILLASKPDENEGYNHASENNHNHNDVAETIERRDSATLNELPEAAQPAPDDGWNIFGAENERGPLSLSEFLGFRGNVFSAYQNAIIVALFNALFCVTFMSLPQLLGNYIINGLRSGMGWLSEAAKLNFHVTQEKLKYVTSYFPIGANVTVKWLEHLEGIQLLIPASLSQKFLLFLNAPVIISTLLSFEEDSAVNYIIETLVGIFAALLTLNMVIELLQNHFAVDFTFGHMRLIYNAFITLKAAFKFVNCILLELIFFPILCGWIIDFSVMPIFQYDRLGFYASYPKTSHLLHWIPGLLQIMYISISILWLRGIFRPGLLHFIRNVDDPEFSPIKETIKKPIHIQFLNVFKSGIVYGFLLHSLYGGFSLVCQILVPKMIPFNADYRKLFLEIPYDLLGHAFNELISRSLRVGGVTDIISAYLRVVCRVLRLSSYIFGGRYKSEESLISGRWVYVPNYDRYYKREKLGKMFRKPVDSIEIARLPVMDQTEDTTTSPNFQTPPVPERRGRAGRTSNNRENNDFTVVYRPDTFKIRIFTLLGLLWLVNEILALLFILTPIIIGRLVFGLLLPKDTHALDIHTFQLGTLCMTLIVKTIQVTWKGLRENGLLDVVQKLFLLPLFAFKVILFTSVVFIAWPMLIGFYCTSLVAPFLCRIDETPLIPIVVWWVGGIVIIKMTALDLDFFLASERASLIRELKTLGGWWNMKLSRMVTKLLLPYTVRFMALSFGPPVVILLLGPLFNLTLAQVLMLQRWSNFIALLIPLVVLTFWLMSQIREKVLRHIRDDYYLLGQRLNNYETK